MQKTGDEMSLEELSASDFVVGLKETERAIDAGKVKHVFIAKDCDERIALPLLEICKERNISVNREFTRKEIGRACKIKVKAATAAVI
ncbi:ribosomal L7Ae/L30e/S12e/Gadd45 family protein [Dialister micraerophilus]|jgi:hypothetical protein|uniref:ribosomal L7Ae/L30e/S12e/Gadd45 family protein n=1 Tax=Dialister micraerophilus TaxID=309120 RepID=UPI0023F0B654|nr:ribosomal L7Ae/L30e/S12e/Gadd45 family protein [Dialister micraerophilus]MDK8285671.1 ribosomal L7Ae/L30e/S12e/Gadd45 family protein [Dialister micraerophilus]